MEQSLAMNLRQLSTIHAIVETGSVSLAAKSLGVSQPALSKIVARTEAELGFSLFDRVGGTVRANAISRMIHARASQVLAMSSQIENDVISFAHGEQGYLRIGYGPATRVRPLPALIDAIAGRFPNVRLLLRQANGVALAAGVQNGEFDFGISYSGNAQTFGDLIRIKLFDNPIVMVAVPGHPIHLEKSPKSGQFLRYAIASVGIVEAMRGAFGRVTQIENANLHAFVCDNNSLVIERVLTGAYLGSGARFLFEREIAAGQLVEIPYDWKWKFECWMIVTEAAMTLPLVRLIAEMARGLRID